MKPIVIGLTGLAHSGKDTSADYLYAQLAPKYHVVKVALADRLKIICQAMIRLFYGIEIPLAEFYDIDRKEAVRTDLPLFAGQPFKLRTMLQMIGTEIFRDLLSESIWCQYIKQHYLDDHPCGVLIISDIRMPNEIEYFSNLVNTGQIASFKCYRIVRDNRVSLSGINQAHKTEQLVINLKIEHEIINQSSLIDLYRNIDQVIIQSNFEL